ncbi:MAG: SPOR domain-containing protein, partial [Acidobacteriota bacterium]
RILSNLETDKEKLLQIVLVGQLNLKDLLRSPELRQLDQRVSIRYELKPLTREETGAYVAHRLTIAGGGSVVSFAPKALDLVHRYTGGIPRLINLVCDRALLGGYTARTNRITPPMVAAAAAGLDLAMPRSSVVGWLRRRAGAFAAGAAAMAMLSTAAWLGGSGVQARSGSRPAAPAPAIVTTTLEPPKAGAPAGVTDAAPRLPSGAGVSGPVATSGSAGDGGTAAAPATDRPAANVEGARAARTRSYSVLVGSFRQDAEAAALLDQLRGLGYHVRVGRIAPEGRGTWHQVYVGPYTDIAAARQDEARVRQLPGYADARLTSE